MWPCRCERCAAYRRSCGEEEQGRLPTAPPASKEKRRKGVGRRLGAPSHHHTDRGVHVSSSGVMATHGKSGNSSSTHCSVAGSVEVGAPRHVEPPSRITGFSRTVSSAVMALVLPAMQGGGASTRTTLAVRTSQGRGTHVFQCVQSCLNAQQRKSSWRRPAANEPIFLLP